MITEKEFGTQVEQLLNTFHWRWVHFRPARVRRGGRDVYETAYTGYKGFPDYVAVRRGLCLIVELKSDDGKLSPEQKEWGDDFKQVADHGLGFMYFVWRPSDFETIAEVLR